MTAYTVAAGDVGKYEIAMTANTEDTVTFGGAAGDATTTDLVKVEVKVLSGTQPVYFCFGTTPSTVKGDHCHDVHPGTGVQRTPPTSGDTVVRLICGAVAVVSVSSGE